MKVKCIKNKGNFDSEITSTYPLTIDKEYNVYSIWVHGDLTQFLIIGEENLPSWYVAELFEVTDNIMPFELYFNYEKGKRITTKWGFDVVRDMILGYQEMVNEDNHLGDLIERDKSAISIFLKRKKEIDKMLE